MNHVICELPHIDFAVAEFQLALTVFLLVEKVTLIDFPALLYILVCKDLEVEREGDTTSAVVIDLAFAVEVVHVPAAIISEAAIGIVEAPFAMHFVVFPVPFVVAAIVVIEEASTISLPIFDLPDIACSHIILNCPLFVFIIVGRDRILILTDLLDSAIEFFDGIGSLGSDWRQLDFGLCRNGLDGLRDAFRWTCIGLTVYLFKVGATFGWSVCIFLQTDCARMGGETSSTLQLLFEGDLIQRTHVVEGAEAMADNFWCSFAAIFWGVEADHFFEEVVNFLYFFEGYLVVLAFVWDWIFDHGEIDLAIVDRAIEGVLFDGWFWPD